MEALESRGRTDLLLERRLGACGKEVASRYQCSPTGTGTDRYAEERKGMKLLL